MTNKKIKVEIKQYAQKNKQTHNNIGIEVKWRKAFVPATINLNVHTHAHILLLHTLFIYTTSALCMCMRVCACVCVCALWQLSFYALAVVFATLCAAKANHPHTASFGMLGCSCMPCSEAPLPHIYILMHINVILTPPSRNNGKC